jgi:hypothetical protein
LPAALKSDREAIEVALYSSLAEEPRVCRIRNTALLNEFWVSESLVNEAQAAGLELLDQPRNVEFDEHGNLQLAVTT